MHFDDDCALGVYPMAEAYQYSPYDMHVQVVWHNQPISSWSYPCTKIEKPMYIHIHHNVP